MNSRRSFSAAVLMVLALGGVSARANVRHFGYVYESGVLAKGEREIELWTTWKSGRDAFYSRFENRLEYEIGLSDRVLTALYLNWKKTSAQDPASGEIASESEFSGLSSEWKVKLLDGAENAFGLAGYAELSLDTDEAELELKLIADKSFGNFRAAYNAVAEFVSVPENGKLRRHELELQHLGGLYLEFSPSWGLGVEGRAFSLVEDGETEFTAVSAGPALHLARGDFWATLTLLSQVSASVEDESRLSGGLELNELERTNLRLLLSLPF